MHHRHLLSLEEPQRDSLVPCKDQRSLQSLRFRWKRCHLLIRKCESFSELQDFHSLHCTLLVLSIGHMCTDLIGWKYREIKKSYLCMEVCGTLTLQPFLLADLCRMLLGSLLCKFFFEEVDNFQCSRLCLPKDQS